MRRRFALIPLVVGAVILAAAGYIVWSNLTGGSLLGKGGAAARFLPGGGAAAARGGGPAGLQREPHSVAGGADRRMQAHPVVTQIAKVGTLTTVVKLTGEAAAAARVEVLPEVAGKVDRIMVTVGSRVDVETVLLTVDPSRPGTRYEPNPIRAPIAGTVIDILVKKGQAVTTSTPTVTIATVGDLELSVRVPERYASIVGARTVARASFDALGDRMFNVWVKRLQPVIDPISRSKEVVFAIPVGTRGIEPGMFGTVELISQRVIDSVIIPFETVVQEADSNYVFVARDGKAYKRKVEIGLLAGDMVEIRSGLAGGESVVTSGQGFLDDGSPISVAGQTAGRIESEQSRQ